MTKLITVQKAKDEVKRLQEYLDLVEDYEANTLEKWIIKEFAITNSLVEVTKRANARGLTLNGSLIDKEYVKSIICGKSTDKLHRLLRLGFNKRIKTIKKGQYPF
ncbi:hypothetical protein [Neobacillus sp. PS3-40]|uniref:hypothetical protein n=1 Tax=Neobacillus sp. PS3-40 TaxID=3070679 RepID=UPI0027E12007|nr:hypothetical protein [Neobacillus sp. PS3-40]WML45470.1 hypothetical protein RCG20_06085 [Neobacillus sp. PS3-40]